MNWFNLRNERSYHYGQFWRYQKLQVLDWFVRLDLQDLQSWRHLSFAKHRQSRSTQLPFSCFQSFQLQIHHYWRKRNKYQIFKTSIRYLRNQHRLIFMIWKLQWYYLAFYEILHKLTGKHVYVSTVRNGKNMGWHFITPLTTVQFSTPVCVYWETLVWIDSDAEKTRISLQNNIQDNNYIKIIGFWEI